jgi:hypothetical protein
MDVVKAANNAFAALSKHVPAEELAKHIEYMRNLINSMVSDARRRKGGVGDGEFFLPGFNIPKGKLLRCTATAGLQYEEYVPYILISTSNVGCQRLVFLIALFDSNDCINEPFICLTPVPYFPNDRT